MYTLLKKAIVGSLPEEEWEGERADKGQVINAMLFTSSLSGLIYIH